MKKLTLLLTLVISSFSTTAFSQDTTVNDIFEELYENNYRPRHCGLNIKDYVAELDKAGVDLSGYSVVALRANMTLFGLLNAQKVRGENRLNERNWYFHVILVDDNDLVYDFSFMNEPTVLDFNEYVEEMFLDEPECDDVKDGRRGTKFCVGREAKLKDYKLEWIKAMDYLEESGEPYKKTKLKDHF